MRRLITASLIAGAAAIAMATAASAAPLNPAHGFTGNHAGNANSLVEEARYRRRSVRRCHTVRRVSWRHGRRIVRLIRFCR